MKTTPRSPAPKLTDLAAQLREQARSSGEDRALTLAHGARIAYRVRDGEVWLSVARRDRPVGDTEQVVFRVQCGVPASARRIPGEGQRRQTIGGATWHQIVWTWREQ